MTRLRAVAAQLFTNALKSPRTTIAGLATIAGVFFPHELAAIGVVASGLGLIFAADGQDGPKDS